MDEKRVTLTHKELKRLKVLQEIEAGRMTGEEAAEALELSERQVKRLKKAYQENGAAGLVHGNRGKASTRRTPEAIRKQVVALAKEEYKDYNDQHFTEELEERYGIVLSRSTVRRIRRGIGQGSPPWRSGARPSTVPGESGDRWRACCCRRMAATTTGWRAVDRA